MFARTLRATLCLTLSLQLVLQPVVVHAQALKVDSGGPVIDTAPNGVPLVNIVPPNAAGISHNRFLDFNVGHQGLVLNNSESAGRSSLGGAVYGNPAIQGGAARLILNEVTGTSPSSLLGPTEVFGRAADYILANPNGITCNGCGFINTPRATLTTGVPRLGPHGDLQGLSIGQGTITVGPKGVDANQLDAFDLVSRSIILDGPVHAQDLGVFAGANDFDYATRTATSRSPTDKSPAVAIDSRLLGGMYADRIHLIATEAGVGVRMAGDMAAGAKGLTIRADGRIELEGMVASQGHATLQSAGDIAITKGLHADKGLEARTPRSLTVGADASVTTAETATVSTGTAIIAGSLAAGTRTQDGGKGQSGNLWLETSGDLSVTGTVAARQDFSATVGGTFGTQAAGRLVAGSNASVTAGTLVLNGGLEVGSSATVSVTDTATIGGSVLSLGDMTISAQAADLSGTLGTGSASAAGAAAFTLAVDDDATISGTIAASGPVSLTAGSGIASMPTARVESADRLTLRAAGASLDGHWLAAKTIAFTLGGNGYRQHGQVIGGDHVSMIADTDAVWTSTGRVSAGGDLSISAGRALSFAGTLRSAQRASLSAARLASSGTLSADHGMVLSATDDLVNTGELTSGADLRLTSDGTMSFGGHGTAAARLDVTARSATIAGRLSTIAPPPEGLVAPAPDVALSVQDDLLLSGALASAGSLSLQAGGSLMTSSASAMDAAGRLDIAAETLSLHGVAQSSGDTLVAVDGWALISGQLAAEGALALESLGSFTTDEQSHLRSAGSLRVVSAADLSAHGSIASGASITLGATAVELDGTVAASTDLTVTSDGPLRAFGTLGSGAALTLTSASAIQLAGTTRADGSASIEGSKVDLEGMLSATDGIKIAASAAATGADTAVVMAGGPLEVTARTLESAALLHADGELHIAVTETVRTTAGSQFLAAENVMVDAKSADIQGAVVAGVAGRDGSLANGAGITLRLDTDAAISGRLAASGDLTLTAGGNTRLGKESELTASGPVELKAEHLEARGSIQTPAALTVAAGSGGGVFSGQTTAGSAIAVTSQSRWSLSETALLASGGDLSLEALDALSVAGTVITGGSLTMTSGAGVQLAGIASSVNGAGLSGAAVTVSGSLASDDEIGISATDGDTMVDGAVSSAAGLRVSSAKDVRVSPGARLATGGDAQLQGARLDLAGDGRVDGTLDITGGHAVLLGSYHSGEDLRVTATSALVVAPGAVLASPTLIGLTSGAGLETAGDLQAGGGVTLSAADLLRQSTAGQILTDGAAHLHGRRLDLSGRVHSGDQAQLGAGSEGIRLAADVLGTTGLTVASLGDVTITSGGALRSPMAWTLDVPGRLVADGLLDSGGDLSLSASSLLGAGQILADGRLGLEVDSALTLGPSAIVASSSDTSLVGESLSLDGILRSGGHLSVTAQDDIRNAGDTLGVTGLYLELGGDLVNETSGALRSPAAWSVVTPGSIINAGLMRSGGQLTLAAQALDVTGAISASQAVSLDARSTLTNTGTVSADGSVTLRAETLENGDAGIISADGLLALTASDTLTNRGTLAASGGLTALASSSMTLGGTATAGGPMALTAGEATTSGTLHAAGPITLSAQHGWTHRATGTLASGGTVMATAGETIASDGTVSAAGALSLRALGALTSDGLLVAEEALALEGAALALDGTIHASGSVTLSAEQAITSTADVFSVAGLTVHGGATVTNGDRGRLASQGTVELRAAGGLTNAGTLSSGTALSLDAAAVRSSGVIVGATDVTLLSGDLLTSDGTLWSGGALTLNAAGDVVTNGTTSAVRGITVRADDWTNGGTLWAGQDLWVDAGGAVTTAGTLGADGDVHLQSSGSWSHAGTFAVAGQFSLNALALDTSGTIAGDSGASIATQSMSNAGSIRFSEDVSLSVTGALSTRSGSILAAASDMSVEGLSVTVDGALVSGGTMTVSSHGGITVGSGGLAHAGDALVLSSATAGLTVDGTAQGGSSGITVAVAEEVSIGRDAALASHGDGRISAASVTSDGRIATAGSLTVVAGPTANQGTIAAGGDLDLSTAGGDLDNLGTIEVVGDTSLAVGDLRNGAGANLLAGGLLQGSASALRNAGRLEGGDGVALEVTGAFTQSSEGTTGSNGPFTLTAASLDLSGSLTTTGALTVQLTDVATLRSGATASAGTAARLSAMTVESAGSIAVAGGALNVTTDGALSNYAGGALTARGGGLTVSAGETLDNQGSLWGDSSLSAVAGGAFLHVSGASIGSNGPTTLRSGQVFTNAGGLAVGGDLSITAPGLVNPGVLLARGALSLDGLRDLDNTGLIFGGAGLDISLTGTLTNREASVVSGGALSISGPGGTKAEGIANLSGVIESTGDMTLSARQIDNRTIYDGILETEGPTVRYDIWPATVSIVDGEGSYGEYWSGHPFFFDSLISAGIINAYPVHANVGYPVYVYPPGPIYENTVPYGPIPGNWPLHGPMCSVFDPTRCSPIDTGSYNVGWARSYILDSTPTNAKAKSQIVAGGSMDVSAETLRNDLAAIRADGDLSLTANTLENQGAAGGRRHMVEGFWYPGHHWRTVFDVDTGSGDYAATITSGGALSGIVRDHIDNTSVFELGPAPTLDRSPVSEFHQRPVTAADGDIDFLALIAGRAIDASLDARGDAILGSLTAPSSVAPSAPGDLSGERARALVFGAPDTSSIIGSGPVDTDGSVSRRGWARSGASITPTRYAIDDDAGRPLVPDLPAGPGADLLAGPPVEPPPPAAVYDPRLPLERLSSDTLDLPPALKPVLSTRGGLNIDAVEAGLAQTVTSFRSLFTRAPPETPALFETRFDYTDLGTFYGSDYFLDRVGGAGFSPEALPKRLGDAFLETRLVRQAILDKTGERYLSPDITNDGDQMRRLMDQAVKAGRSLDLTPGVALSAAQLTALDRDILWYVETVVDGQRVLAPRLYLAEASRGRLTETGALITGASVDLEVSDGTLTNSGTIAARDDDLRLSARDGIFGTAGRLEARHDVLLSSSDGAIALANASIEHTDALFTRTVRLGQGTVVAGRDLIIDGTAGVALTGVDLTAGRDLGLVSSAGSITVDPESIRKTATTGWRDIRRVDGSRLSAGGKLFFSAARDISLTAAELSAGGGMALSTLLGDIVLDAALQRDYTHFASKKHTFTFDARSHRVTTLEAGGDVTLDAGGSLGLRGAQVSGEAVALRARTGGVALQAVTDSVFQQTIKTKSGPVFTASSDSGRYDETVRMVEIAARGPLTVEAALGVAAEVVDAGGSLEATLDVLAERPGLAWISQLRARDDIAWSAIAEAHRAWDYRSQGLSPAAAMVISLAVAAAIPAGAGAGLLGIEGAIGGAMADAALTSLASQAAVALAGNQGDLGATFRQLASADTLRGLAVAVASAGLTSAATDALNLPTGSDLSFPDRLRTAAVQAGARTAVDATLGGRDLDEALRANLLSAAASTIGAELAGEIGEAARNGDIDTVAQLAAHAALGCGMGAATGGDDGCASGAGGAVVGELVGMAVEAEVQEELKRAIASGGAFDGDALIQLRETGVDFARLASALAVAVAGGDAAVAADTGANAAENNALETVWDLVSFGASVAELGIAIKDGDTIDILLAGGSVVIDGAAIILPGIPGGAGMALKATREGGTAAVRLFDRATGATIAVAKQTDTGIVWGRGIQGQGMPWEDTVARRMPAGSRLPQNFKTFDFFDEATRTAVSAKTLDTTTPAKVRRPEQVYHAMKRSVDAAASFTEHGLSGMVVHSSKIAVRRVEMAIPAQTTPAQWEQVRRAVTYAKDQGVDLIITVIQ